MIYMLREPTVQQGANAHHIYDSVPFVSQFLFPVITRYRHSLWRPSDDLDLPLTEHQLRFFMYYLMITN